MTFVHINLQNKKGKRPRISHNEDMPLQIGNATSEKMLLFGGPNPSSHLVSETTMLSYPSSHLAFNSRRVQMSHPYNDSYGSYKLKR